MKLRSLFRPLRPFVNFLQGKPAALNTPDISWRKFAPDFQFRAGTWDRNIFHAVFTHNEYNLPKSFAPDDVILDIGAHIGSFCLAAASRGSRRVYGFEAETDNARCAAANLRSLSDRVRIQNKAVWRSDKPVDHLFFQGASDGNTGGGNVGWAEAGRKVDAVPLDEVIREVAHGGKRVRFLKIDCEGAEFAILLTSKLLHLIDEIGGEFHEFGGDYDPHEVPNPARIDGIDRFTIVELTAALEKAGFEVTSKRTPGSNIGLFFAKARHVK